MQKVYSNKTNSNWIKNLANCIQTLLALAY